MCASVYFRGEQIDNQGALKRAANMTVLPMRPGYSQNASRDDVCLCPVDVQEVARRLGVYCEYDGNMCYDFQEIDRS